MNIIPTLSALRPWMFTVGGTVLISAALLYGLLPTSREVLRTTAPHTPEDVEQFGGSRSLGQSFIAPADRLAEIHLSFRAPIPRDAFPMLFHLRHGRYATTDVRTVTVSAADVDAHGVLRIRFLPVPKSGGRTYAMLLDAGRAPWKQLAAYRQIDGSIYEQGYLFFGETAQVGAGDLEFALITREPRILNVWHARVRPFLDQLQGRAGIVEQRYLVRTPRLFRALVVGVLVSVLAVALRRFLHATESRIRIFLGMLVVAHILLHAPFLVPYPGVNDEGSYLMDIQNIRAGYWPFRDTLTKGPLFLLVLAPVALFLPHSLLPARLLVAGVSGIEVLLLYLLGRRLGGPTVGLLAAALWALSPITVAQTSQLFLQPFSLPLVTLALILALPPSGHTPSRGNVLAAFLTPRRVAMLAGVLLALAYCVRASSLAFIVPALALVFIQQDMRTGIRRVIDVLLGFGGMLALVALPALFVLGTERTAVMFNLEAFIIGHARSGGESAAAAFSFLPPREILERFNAHGAVLFRVGMPLVLLWIAAIAHALTKLLRLPHAVGVIGFLGLSFPILQRVYASNFTLAGELANFGPSFKVLTAIATILIAAALWWFPTPVRLSARPLLRMLILLGGTWISLAMLYMFFGRFRQQYHTEFLPLYVLGSATFLASILPTMQEKGLSPFLRRWWHYGLGAALSTVVAAAIFLSFIPSREQPHTGSIPHRTALSVGRILRRHSEPREEILTAQGLFTFYADRFLPFGASHPGWYLEERVGTVPTELRRLFLPDKEELRRAMREKPIRLVAIDRRTREIYFTYDPEMQALLKSDYRLLETVPNPYEEDPVEIWIRK